MNGRLQRALFACLLVAILLLVAQTAQACPTCKDGLAEGKEHVAKGYFWSILFMMSMPFLIFSGLGLYFYLSIRRARRQRTEPAAESRESNETAAVQQTLEEPAGELLEVS